MSGFEWIIPLKQHCWVAMDRECGVRTAARVLLQRRRERWRLSRNTLLLSSVRCTPPRQYIPGTHCLIMAGWEIVFREVCTPADWRSSRPPLCTCSSSGPPGTSSYQRGPPLSRGNIRMTTSKSVYQCRPPGASQVVFHRGGWPGCQGEE
jgi:hypothetical protein